MTTYTPPLEKTHEKTGNQTKLTISMPKQIHKALKITAAENDVTMSQLLITSFRLWQKLNSES